MIYTRKNSGTCSSSTTVEIEGDIIKNVSVEGGCNGNLKGIAKLCEGKNVDEIIGALKGTTCGFKNTSCPDQIALALIEAKQKQG